MADQTSKGGLVESKAARGQTIVRAYPHDGTSGNSGLSDAGGKISSPGDAFLDLPNTGLSRSLKGPSVAGPTPGRKDTTD